MSILGICLMIEPDAKCHKSAADPIVDRRRRHSVDWSCWPEEALRGYGNLAAGHPLPTEGSERAGIETYSIGESIERRVVVAPKRDEGAAVPRDSDEEYRQYS